MQGCLPNGAKDYYTYRTFEDIMTYVLDKYNGVHPNDIGKFIGDSLKKAKLLKDDIVAELSFVRDLPGYEKEVSAIDELDSISWGISAQAYLNSRTPKVVYHSPWSRAQGLLPPPHEQI